MANARSASSKAASGKSNSDDPFNRAKQQDKHFIEEKAKAHKTAVDKIARLRALRLAKEAADEEAAKLNPPEPKPSKKKKSSSA